MACEIKEDGDLPFTVRNGTWSFRITDYGLRVNEHELFRFKEEKTDIQVALNDQTASKFMKFRLSHLFWRFH